MRGSWQPMSNVTTPQWPSVKTSRLTDTNGVVTKHILKYGLVPVKLPSFQRTVADEYNSHKRTYPPRDKTFFLTQSDFQVAHPF